MVGRTARGEAKVNKTERAVELHEAIQRAAGELPEDWEIEISIERDAADVKLFHDGEPEYFPTNYESMAEQINSAVQHAVDQEAKGGEG